MTDLTAPMTRELVDRTRRMETKLTKLMDHLGMDVVSPPPNYRNGVVTVGSHSVLLKEILGVIPPGVTAPIRIMCGDETIATLQRGDG